METLDYWHLAVAVLLFKGGGEIRIESSIKYFQWIRGRKFKIKYKRQRQTEEWERARSNGQAQRNLLLYDELHSN